MLQTRLTVTRCLQSCVASETSLTWRASQFCIVTLSFNAVSCAYRNICVLKVAEKIWIFISVHLEVFEKEFYFGFRTWLLSYLKLIKSYNTLTGDLFIVQDLTLRWQLFLVNEFNCANCIVLITVKPALLIKNLNRTFDSLTWCKKEIWIAWVLVLVFSSSTLL